MSRGFNHATFDNVFWPAEYIVLNIPLYDIYIILSRQQVSQPSQSEEEILNTSSNGNQPEIDKQPMATATREEEVTEVDAKRKVGGRERIRDLPKITKESSKMAKLRRKYATRQKVGPRTWDEAKRRFWREWADRRGRHAQKWIVSRVPPSRGLIVGGVKSWKQKENVEIVELELCIVDHSNTYE